MEASVGRPRRLVADLVEVVLKEGHPLARVKPQVRLEDMF